MNQKLDNLKNKISDTQIVSVLYALSICLILISLYRYRHFYHDDAFISLKYTRNFLEGNGLVWNIGERVEGYTNLFFILCTALLNKIGVDLQLASQLLGFAGFGFILVLVNKFVNLFNFNKLEKAFTFFFVSTAQSYIIWSYGGLETVFYSALVLSLFYLLYFNIELGKNNKLAIYFLFLITSLTRPDCVIFLFTFSLYFVLKEYRDKDYKSLSTTIVYASLVILLPIVWRYYYYDDIFPNTYYTKTGFNLTKLRFGIRYFYYFTIENLSIALLVIYSLYELFFNKVNLNQFLKLTFASCFLFFMYILIVGGDHMPAYRFILPVFAILILSVWYLFKINKTPINRYFITGLIILNTLQTLITFNTNFTTVSYRTALDMDYAAYFGTCVGKIINNKFPKNSLIALNTAGSIPYYAPNNRYIDMLGLTDKVIGKRKEIPFYKDIALYQGVAGHSKGDGKYVIERKPDYIIIGPCYGTTIDKPWFLSDYEIGLEKDFYKNYELKIIKCNAFDYFSFYEIKQYFDFIYYERISK